MCELTTGKIPTPYLGGEYKVKSEWIDHNGHMNVAFYLSAFDSAIGDFFKFLGLDKNYRKENDIATFCGDFHIHYVRELFEETSLKITSQLVYCDKKRIQICQSMYSLNEGYLAAQSEVIYLHVNGSSRRVMPMSSWLSNRMKMVLKAHSALPRPKNQSRIIGKPLK